ncbi:MAG: DUF1326 domain-containing protein [Actinomycetota bacterium]
MDAGLDPHGGYALSGTMLEVYERMPLWSANGERRAEGSSLTTWLVDEGSVAGVGVSGMTVVTLTLDAPGTAPGRAGRLILLEEDAQPEQVRWIVDALHGRLGGPLAAVAGLMPAELGFYQVPINYRFQRRSVMIDVPRMVRVVASGLELDLPGGGPDPGGRLWPDWSGEASEATVDIPDMRLRTDLSGCRAVRGTFRFRS